MNISASIKLHCRKTASPCVALLAGLLLVSSCATTPLSNQSEDDARTNRAIAPPNFTRGLLPRRTSDPLYPVRAESLGIEGWVMLSFSVDENGEVINSTIDTIDQEPIGYFESSAKTAARRLTFENTRGQIVEDIRYVYRYELLDASSRSSLLRSRSDEVVFRELIPLRYITPAYPIDAVEQSIEGYVVVKFIVTAEGSVENIVIDESEPAGIFDAEAIRAAARLRFDPRIMSDVPVTVEDVLYRFDWQLDR